MTDKKTPMKIIDPEYAETNFDFRLTHYNMDDKGAFSHELKNNWGHKEITNKQTWIIAHERIDEARKRVLAGLSSPIDFYMETCIMDVKLLSEFVGIAKWRIRRHMKPSVFKKLSKKILQQYADAFEITIEQLTDTEYIKKD